jgi:hypothetical protein
MNNPGAQYSHNTHVLIEGMNCCDCHVYSVRCSIDRHPDPSNPSDTVDTLIQLMRPGIGGMLIPAADRRMHLNNETLPPEFFCCRRRCCMPRPAGKRTTSR